MAEEPRQYTSDSKGRLIRVTRRFIPGGGGMAFPYRPETAEQLAEEVLFSMGRIDWQECKIPPGCHKPRVSPTGESYNQLWDDILGILDPLVDFKPHIPINEGRAYERDRLAYYEANRSR